MNTPEPFNDLSWNDDPLHSPNRTEYIEKLRARVKELESENAHMLQVMEAVCAAVKTVLDRTNPGQSLLAKLTALEKEVSRLKNYLERAGWGECNIPACNCNGWHKLRESSDERQMFEDVEILRRKNDALEKERDQLKGEVADARWLLQNIWIDMKGHNSVVLCRRRDAWLAKNPTPYDATERQKE